MPSASCVWDRKCFSTFPRVLPTKQWALCQPPSVLWEGLLVVFFTPNTSQECVRGMGQLCCLGVGLDNPHGSLPTVDILQFWNGRCVWDTKIFLPKNKVICFNRWISLLELKTYFLRTQTSGISVYRTQEQDGKGVVYEKGIFLSFLSSEDWVRWVTQCAVPVLVAAVCQRAVGLCWHFPEVREAGCCETILRYSSWDKSHHGWWELALVKNLRCLRMMVSLGVVTQCPLFYVTILVSFPETLEERVDVVSRTPDQGTSCSACSGFLLSPTCCDVDSYSVGFPRKLKLHREFTTKQHSLIVSSARFPLYFLLHSVSSATQPANF